MTYDEIGRYRFEPGWCFRDALRIVGHPASEFATANMTPDQMRAFCAEHSLDLRTSGVVDMDGRLGIYLYRIDDKSGHAVFCEDIHRVLAAGLDIIGIIIL